MKQLLAVAVAIVSFISVRASGHTDPKQTWTGTISDSQCGGNHGGEVDERECTQKCIKNREQYVLVTDLGTKVWRIANQDFAGLPEHAGHVVKVTGELKDAAIVVSSIEMPKR